MTLFYEKRNRDNLAKLAVNTKAAALKWYEFCVKNSINILIYETIRTESKQREYVASGASKTMRSYHLVGQALDFVPVDSKGNCLWNGYGATNIKKAIAEAKRLGFEWGGDWKSFVDKPHLQFNYKGYGTDTFDNKAYKDTKPKQEEEKEEEVNWLMEPVKFSVKEMENALLRVLNRFEQKDPALGKEWRTKFINGELTGADALGILYVAVDRGYITGKSE